MVLQNIGTFFSTAKVTETCALKICLIFTSRGFKPTSTEVRVEWLTANLLTHSAKPSLQFLLKATQT